MLINFISNEYFGLHFCILKSHVPLSLLYTATLKYFSSSQIIRSLTTTAKDKRQKLRNSLRATNSNGEAWMHRGRDVWRHGNGEKVKTKTAIWSLSPLEAIPIPHQSF